jgi:hypothetical protein
MMWTGLKRLRTEAERITLFQEQIYSNPSVDEQSVYEFSLIRDAQINTCFFFNL